MIKSDDVPAKDAGYVFHPTQAGAKRGHRPMSHVEGGIDDSAIILASGLLKK